MMSGALRFAAVCVLLLAPPPQAARAAFEYSEVKDSVVRVMTVVKWKGKRREAGHGTGFVINDRGNVVTNHHVVTVDRSKFPRGMVLEGLFVPDGDFDTLRAARVVWSSKPLDLAVLEVEGLRRPPVSLAEVEPDHGVNVFPVGFPGVAESFVGEKAELLKPAVSNGVVAKVLNGGNPSEPATIRRLVQHTATLNPGNSGGPLFNGCNEVIGINTFGARTILPVQKDSQGNIIAAGSPPSGVFFSGHSSVLMAELKSEDIPFTVASSACVVALAGSGTPFDIYLYVAVAAVLAASAIVLALRKPRERVVRVVESYSQMLRRKGGRSTGPVGPSAGESRPSPAAEVEEASWRLKGEDSEGKPVDLRIGVNTLMRKSKGLILGRNEELCDLLLNDSSVSRRHVRFMMTHDGLTIEDLNSSNGTRVDGRSLPPYKAVTIHVGGQVELGSVRLKVSQG